MHIAPVDPNTSAVSHGGERYEPDENGLFDVPAELAERLLAGPGWEVATAPEPEGDDAPAKKPRTRTRTSKAVDA